MDTKNTEAKSRPVLITIIAMIFIVWGVIVLLDFTGIQSPKIDGKAVNVILGFRILGTYAKVMDSIQLILIVLMVYGLFRMKKIPGYVIPFAYMIYSFVSIHSWALMSPDASLRAKIGFDLFALFGGGIVCLILYINRKKFV